MGRIRTKLIKNVSDQIFEAHGHEFTKDFEKNKQLVDKFADVPSTKMRNVIAGSITRRVKAET